MTGGQGALVARRSLRSSLRRAVRRAVVPLLFVSAGCARGSQAGAVDYPDLGPLMILVRNDNYLDMNVFAIVEGTSRRLGTVTGTSSASFTIRANGAFTQGVSLRAVPIGGQGAFNTGTINLGRDEVIVFEIAPLLRQSSFTVRDTL